MEARLARFSGKRIGVLMGGDSSEREISLRSGENVFRALSHLGLQAIKVDIGSDPIAALRESPIDIAYIALHGSIGENGVIQALLELLHIPYTGSRVLGSALGMDKNATKRILRGCGLDVPLSLDGEGDIDRMLEKVKQNLSYPVVFKANCEGSSVGVELCENEETLRRVLEKNISQYPDYFIEQYIRGREMTIGVLGQYPDFTFLPILELRPKNAFYDFEAKYTKGMTEFVLPAPMDNAVREHIERQLVYAMRVMKVKGPLRFDFMFTGDNRAFFLEVNTSPGMTETSDIPAMAEAAGISREELVLRILESAE
ncbi:D-alanine--D-alanine ligase family protein [Thermospira aquatica]|uniref:D-alanine--D-alanine ligase n=1 Tax=Thermospira aquatica TaxID=2828656 RepID=A0AAX3BE57_9SPIR|nr:D-alanine--D-alanine ligase [Thermospira aquatica]URA10021.1 D-alanine--D-alanine ligase [Thermospira aquatica]